MNCLQLKRLAIRWGTKVKDHGYSSKVDPQLNRLKPSDGSTDPYAKENISSTYPVAEVSFWAMHLLFLLHVRHTSKVSLDHCDVLLEDFHLPGSASSNRWKLMWFAMLALSVPKCAAVLVDFPQEEPFWPFFLLWWSWRIPLSLAVAPLATSLCLVLCCLIVKNSKVAFAPFWGRH